MALMCVSRSLMHAMLSLELVCWTWGRWHVGMSGGVSSLEYLDLGCGGIGTPCPYKQGGKAVLWAVLCNSLSLAVFLVWVRPRHT